MQLVNAAASFALMIVVLLFVEFREALVHDTTPIRLTARALNTSSIATGSNATVDINIERWSTEEERQKVHTAFLDRGPERLLVALQDLKRVGYIRLPNALGYDLHFARQVRLEAGGRKIIVATGRRIGFAEASNQPRTIDYPFTLIEIRMKPDGTGEGKMAIATTISLNEKDQTIELENYSSEPVRLQNVTIDSR
jgi:hypothetical protein